jgi:hypothetical protein
MFVESGDRHANKHCLVFDYQHFECRGTEGAEPVAGFGDQ